MQADKDTSVLDRHPPLRVTPDGIPIVAVNQVHYLLFLHFKNAFS